MAGRPGRKPQQPQPKPFDEFAEEGESFDEDLPVVDAKGKPKAASPTDVRSRDWRDVERYREERELKKLVGEDLDQLFDERPHRRTGK
jgi:hypothetical protein